MLEKTNNEVFW